MFIYMYEEIIIIARSWLCFDIKDIHNTHIADVLCDIILKQRETLAFWALTSSFSYKWAVSNNFQKLLMNHSTVRIDIHDKDKSL